MSLLLLLLILIVAVVDGPAQTFLDFVPKRGTHRHMQAQMHTQMHTQAHAGTDARTHTHTHLVAITSNVSQSFNAFERA